MVRLDFADSANLGPTYNRDLERIEAPIYSVKGHNEIINAIDAIGGLGIGGGAPEIVTGSRDGKKKKDAVKPSFYT